MGINGVYSAVSVALVFPVAPVQKTKTVFFLYIRRELVFFGSVSGAEPKPDS